MAKIKNLAGRIFGPLTAIEHTGFDRFGNAMWKCRCICGKIKTASNRNLQNSSRKAKCRCDRGYNRATPENINPVKRLESGKRMGNILVHSVLTESEWAWVCE